MGIVDLKNSLLLNCCIIFICVDWICLITGTDYPYDVKIARKEDEGFGFIILSSVSEAGSFIVGKYQVFYNVFILIFL